MRWKTRHPDGDTYDGVVVSLQRSFIIVQEELSFQFDGFQLLPKRSLKGYRDGLFEQTDNKVLKFHKETRAAGCPDWLKNCKSLSQVFDALRRRGIWPGIETLVADEDDFEFFLGQITESTATEVRVLCYKATGEWEREFTIPYDQIFRVEILSTYCERFNEYMRSKVRRF